MTDKKKFTLKKIDPAAPRIITWPVPVNVPQDGGKIEEQEMTVKFAVLSNTQIDELTSPETVAAWNADPQKPKYASPLLWTVVKGFVDLREEENGPVLSDEEAVPKVLNSAAACVALSASYFGMVNGRAQKN